MSLVLTQTLSGSPCSSVIRRRFENVGYLVVEFHGSILMFVPLGDFAALLLSYRYWWALLFLGTLFSGFIELGQLLFLPDGSRSSRSAVQLDRVPVGELSHPSPSE